MTPLPPAWHAWLIALPLASVIYDLMAATALESWMREPPSELYHTPTPVTFFRPLKRGVPRLREKLETLVHASRPADQILLGVDADSEEETLAAAVRSAFPDRDIIVVRCQPDAAVNPKISKLVQMEPEARHDSWLLSDSEVIFSSDFLTAFRREWQESASAALTAGYRFVRLASWPQRCDALAVLLGLWPGLALVRRYGRVNFTLGACTLFRRADLISIGGWKAVGRDLAEDQRLGEALAQSGRTIRLSRQVATLDSDPLSWPEYWRHQRRVAVTFRAANPAGFAGVALTFGPLWCLLGLLAFSPAPWFLLATAFTIISRGWRVWKTARRLDFPVPGMFAALSLASLVEALCWALSWFPARVWWSRRWWRVDFRGKLSPAHPREQIKE